MIGRLCSEAVVDWEKSCDALGKVLLVMNNLCVFTLGLKIKLLLGDLLRFNISNFKSGLEQVKQYLKIKQFQISKSKQSCFPHKSSSLNTKNTFKTKNIESVYGANVMN